MPEDFSDSRRKFLGYAIGGVAGVVTIGYAVPLVNYLIKPALRSTAEPWAKVGVMDELELVAGEPKAVTFHAELKVGWAEEKVEHDVWVVKKPDGSVTVFSPTCPHLGCGYRWDTNDRLFKCPCHASVFDPDGKVIGGPAPRALDTLPAKVEGGALYVEFKKFRLGLADKVEA